MRAPLRWLAVALALSCPSQAARAAEPDRCSTPAGRPVLERIYGILNVKPAPSARCTFHGFQSESPISVAYSLDGQPLPAVRVVPATCAKASATLLTGPGDFAIDVPAQVRTDCPEVIELLTRVATEVPWAAAFVPPKPGKDEAAADFKRRRSEGDPDWLSLSAGVATMALILALATLLAVRSRRLLASEGRWTGLSAAGFVAGLALRATLPFTMGNWYLDVLPATGPPPGMKYGPGLYGFEWILRLCSLWGVHGLVWSQLVLGALAIPLLVGVLKELRLSWWAALAAVVWLVFAPFHARLSATSNEHVLASTLALGLLFAWLRAYRTGEALWFALALLLLAGACLTRVDMAAQAACLCVWPLLRDAAEREGLAPASIRYRFVAILAAVGSAMAVALYVFVVLPAKHPVAPFTDIERLIGQYPVLASTSPGWISLSSVLFAWVGILWLLINRRLLLLRVTLTLLIPFMAIGRSFANDELVSARYFLLMIPIMLIPAAVGFDAVISAVASRLGAGLAPVGTVAAAGLALWTGWAAQPAYRTSYAFQDEYLFAQEALRKLPAGCTVYQVEIRPPLGRDLDCCLDLRHSPLQLAFPNLNFLPLPADPASVFAEGTCHAYYESTACDLTPGPQALTYDSRLFEHFKKGCSAARNTGHLSPVAETSTSTRATVDVFSGARPHVGLYLWTQ